MLCLSPNPIREPTLKQWKYRRIERHRMFFNAQPSDVPDSFGKFLVFPKILPRMGDFTKLVFVYVSIGSLKIHSKCWKILRAICGGGRTWVWGTKKKLNSGEWLWGTILQRAARVLVTISRCFSFVNDFPVFYWHRTETLRKTSAMENVFVAWGFSLAENASKLTLEYFWARDRKNFKLRLEFMKSFSTVFFNSKNLFFSNLITSSLSHSPA